MHGKGYYQKILVHNIGRSVLKFIQWIDENVAFRYFLALARKFEAKKQRLCLYTMKKPDFYRSTILNREIPD